jgi:hypothetical protein
MEDIKAALQAQGMNADEIKRYIDNMKGEAINISDDEDLTAANTKTKITLRKSDAINHDDINFDLEKNLDNTTPLEFDENEMPFSLRTEKRKTDKLDVTPKGVVKGAHKTDDTLKDRSFVDKKPKMKAKKGTGMNDSVKLGSVDDEESSSEESAKSGMVFEEDKKGNTGRAEFGGMKAQHARKNSVTVPAMKMEDVKKVKVGEQEDEVANMDDIDEEEFTESDEVSNSPGVR